MPSLDPPAAPSLQPAADAPTNAVLFDIFFPAVTGSHPCVDLCLSGPTKLEHVKELVNIIEEEAMSPEELSFMCEFGDARH